MNDDYKDQDKVDQNISILDPYANREAEKYSNPIPSREYIISVLQKFNEPLSFGKLQEQLNIINEQDRLALRRRLKAMIRDGQLKKKSKNYYLKDLVKPHYYTTILDHEHHPAQLKKIIGNLFVVNGFNYVSPFLSKELSQDILIPDGYENEAKLGDCVEVEVVMPVFKWADPVGKVLKVLGKANNRKVLINAAILSLEIPHIWHAEIKQEVGLINKNIDLELIRSRVDLRHLDFVTIDGEDAKDFDDAVFCEILPRNNWRLYVAIADVSYYVKPDTAIDLEANLRGNSVYFPGKVISMLPELLANELCSLQANIDRLALVCEMQISSKGKLTKYTFYEAIIRSKARLTYNQVDQFLRDPKNKELTKKISDNISELHNLYGVLRKQRNLRGAIDFETAESKLVFNSKGEPIDVKAFKRNVAHKIIEECMLCANVATAKFLEQHKLLSIYRVHEGPKSLKLLDLKAFLAGIGLSLENEDNPTPKDYAKLLQSIADRPDADVIQMILLRSMCQAVYSTDNIGHFGLAYAAYTHFTSPIRRYTDLLVHRHIKLVLHQGTKNLNTDPAKLDPIAEHCSMTERRADEATREVIKACKCQYLSKFIGNKFTGIISGITKFGLFVEIKDIYIDGLVHINSLGDDYFLHDPIHHKLVGERTGKIYALGMELEIILARVDLDKRRIDFILATALNKAIKNRSKITPVRGKKLQNTKSSKIKANKFKVKSSRSNKSKKHKYVVKEEKFSTDLTNKLVKVKHKKKLKNNKK